jgi:hypothetical protein
VIIRINGRLVRAVRLCNTGEWVVRYRCKWVQVSNNGVVSEETVRSALVLDEGDDVEIG